jgi:hypothetical protein
MNAQTYSEVQSVRPVAWYVLVITKQGSLKLALEAYTKSCQANLISFSVALILLPLK